ncbi:MAG: response regulator transcription factor [Acidaminococcaceae bacterium]|nr:response regulator transcription factor [Acidaminococcaceae bacterium]
MQIAIVDDSKKDRNESFAFLKNFLQKKLPKDYFPLVLKGFHSADKFFEAYKPGCYQIIFLDIFMPGQNGIEVARRIRREKDPCKIIFLTVTEDMAMEGYSVFASGYLIKPLSERGSDLCKILNHILPEIKADTRQLSVRSDRTLISYMFSKIVYIECYGSHFVTLHVRENPDNEPGRTDNAAKKPAFRLTAVKTQSTFSECFKKLSVDPRFLECYHRVCINMEYVASMEEDSFVLETGLSIPISRRRKAEVKQRYMAFLSQQ